MSRAFHLLALVLLALTLACGGDTPSQIMIRVSLGPGLEAESYDTSVTITSASPESPQTSTESVARGAFPLCVAVLPVDDDATRTFHALVQLRRGDVVVASREVETGFVAGELRVVSLEMRECASGDCGPVIQPRASDLPTLEAGACSGSGDDAATDDAGPVDTNPDTCIAAPGSPCAFLDVLDGPSAFYLRRGFFANETLVLYGETDRDVYLREVWPESVGIAVYSAIDGDELQLPLTAAGGAYLDGRPCVALATTPATSITLRDDGAQIFGGNSANQFLVCEGIDPDSFVRVTDNLAMGERDDAAVYFYEIDSDRRWFLGNGSLGQATGELSQLLVRGGNNLDCASASFGASWTTYHTNQFLRAEYTATGQDAMTTCKVASATPAYTYHFGGPGSEQVTSLLVNAPQVFVLVEHTAALTLQVGQETPATNVAPGAGWTVMALSSTELLWSQTFSEPSTLAMLGRELVIATLAPADTTQISWRSTDDFSVSREANRIDGSWSLVATDGSRVSRKLGLVSARANDAEARVIILAD